MLTPEQQDALIEDIATWLASAPSREDILLYVKKLPEEHYESLETGVDVALIRLQAKKWRYLNEQGWSTFVDELGESDQVRWLASFAAYTSDSVLKKLLEEHPELGSLSLPSDISKWAQQYTLSWNACLEAAVTPEFLTSSIYVRSFLNLAFDDQAIAAFRQQVERFTLDNSRIFEQDGTVPAGQLQEEKQFLTQLQILPEEYIARLIQEGEILGKLILFDRLHAIFTLLSVYGYTKAKQDPETFIDALWEYLLLSVENEVIAKMDGEHFADTKLKGVKDLYEYFNALWTLSTIESGAIDVAILEYANQLTPEQRSYFYENLSEFLLHSPVVEALLEPLESYPYLSRLFEGAKTNQAIAVSNEILEAVPEENKPLVSRFLQMVRMIYQQA